MDSVREFYEKIGGNFLTHDFNLDIRRMDKRRQLKFGVGVGIKHLSWILELLIQFVGVEERYENRLIEQGKKRYASYSKFMEFNPFLYIEDEFMTPTTTEALQILKHLKYLDVRTINGEIMYSLRKKCFNPKLYKLEVRKTMYFPRYSQDADGNPILH